jgi:hypothetical protein
MLLPWPSRQQRQAAISAARTQKEASQAGAAHAALIERDIDRIRQENHIGAIIADQFMRGHGNGAAR